MKFKIGDRVRVVRGPVEESVGSCCGVYSKREGVITSTGGLDYGHIQIDNSVCYQPEQLELITTTMDIKEKFQLAFKSEPEKSFRKAGVTNGDDYLTDDGQKIFLSWLLKKHGAEFKTEVVDSLLEEEKAA